jgi:hypothetical protein
MASMNSSQDTSPLPSASIASKSLRMSPGVSPGTVKSDRSE